MNDSPAFVLNGEFIVEKVARNRCHHHGDLSVEDPVRELVDLVVHGQTLTLELFIYSEKLKL